MATHQEENKSVMTLCPLSHFFSKIVVPVGTVISNTAPIGTTQQALGYIAKIVDKFILAKFQSKINLFNLVGALLILNFFANMRHLQPFQNSLFSSWN